MEKTTAFVCGIYGWGKSLLASDSATDLPANYLCCVSSCVCKCVCQLACVELNGNSRQREELLCISHYSLHLKAIETKKRFVNAPQPKSRDQQWGYVGHMRSSTEAEPHNYTSWGLTVGKQDGSCPQFITAPFHHK